MSTPDSVAELHTSLAALSQVGPLIDERPGDDYVSFRCWDPDGTEIEVYWDGH